MSIIPPRPPPPTSHLLHVYPWEKYNVILPIHLWIAHAEPHPFYHLWCHQLLRWRTTLSSNLYNQGEEIFKTTPEWEQFSQGGQRKRKKNYVTLTQKCSWKSWSTTHLPFLSFKSFPKNSSHRRRQGKESKRWGRRESEKKNSRLLCDFLTQKL